jgi:hypothetical protein
MWTAVKESSEDWGLWDDSLKIIESSFGSGVGSYFRFLKAMLMLNLIVGILM